MLFYEEVANTKGGLAPPGGPGEVNPISPLSPLPESADKLTQLQVKCHKLWFVIL